MIARLITPRVASLTVLDRHVRTSLRISSVFVSVFTVGKSGLTLSGGCLLSFGVVEDEQADMTERCKNPLQCPIGGDAEERRNRMAKDLMSWKTRAADTAQQSPTGGTSILDVIPKWQVPADQNHKEFSNRVDGTQTDSESRQPTQSAGIPMSFKGKRAGSPGCAERSPILRHLLRPWKATSRMVERRFYDDHEYTIQVPTGQRVYTLGSSRRGHSLTPCRRFGPLDR